MFYRATKSPFTVTNTQRVGASAARTTTQAISNVKEVRADLLQTITPHTSDAVKAADQAIVALGEILACSNAIKDGKR